MHYSDADFMQRCINLAQLGKGFVAPNPMVGAVLVHENNIIGEGWHQQYGGPHAEVNCIHSVAAHNQHLIPHSTLYVSLEPCAHFGKTPPCAQFIIDYQIPKVVIGCLDPFDKVAGNGIAMLQALGIHTTIGVLESACQSLNAAFFTFHTKKRPYIILKWAASADNFIAPLSTGNFQISNVYSKLWLHKMRAQYAAFAVGAQTARLDNPQLTNRLWPSSQQPIRVLFDPELLVPDDAAIFNEDAPTIVFNYHKNAQDKQVSYVKVAATNFLPDAMQYLYQHMVQSIVIEGGTFTLQSFIDADLWDEAWEVQTPLCLGSGVAAPQLKHAQKHRPERLGDNLLIQYLRQSEK